jgi:hypothetical protein
LNPDPGRPWTAKGIGGELVDQVIADLVAMVHDAQEHGSLPSWTGRTTILGDTLLIVGFHLFEGSASISLRLC